MRARASGPRCCNIASRHGQRGPTICINRHGPMAPPSLCYHIKAHVYRLPLALSTTLRRGCTRSAGVAPWMSTVRLLEEEGGVCQGGRPQRHPSLPRHQALILGGLLKRSGSLVRTKSHHGPRKGKLLIAGGRPAVPARPCNVGWPSWRRRAIVRTAAVIGRAWDWECGPSFRKGTPLARLRSRAWRLQ
jgi:hypothetical protein